MSNTQKAKREQAKKSLRPTKVTGKKIVPSRDTIAFQDGMARLGGKRSVINGAGYERRPKHRGRGFGDE